VRAQGPAEWLEAAGHGIGSSRPGSQSVASAELNPGDSLVLYSAGAVEGSRDLVEGLSLLRSTAVALRRHPVAGWARRALEALNPQSPVGREATVVMVRLGSPE
jgi:serine phosphatase RsbU (regulator of sigma subunit)